LIMTHFLFPDVIFKSNHVKILNNHTAIKTNQTGRKL